MEDMDSNMHMFHTVANILWIPAPVPLKVACSAGLGSWLCFLLCHKKASSADVKIWSSRWKLVLPHEYVLYVVVVPRPVPPPPLSPLRLLYSLPGTISIASLIGESETKKPTKIPHSSKSYVRMEYQPARFPKADFHLQNPIARELVVHKPCETPGVSIEPPM